MLAVKQSKKRLIMREKLPNSICGPSFDIVTRYRSAMIS